MTPEQIRAAFLIATQSWEGALQRWQADAAKGLTDCQLAERLAYELGVYGGHASTDIDVEYTGEGLRIWASHTGFVRRTTDKPVLQGAATVAFARRVYGIPDPADHQLPFL